MSFKKIPGPAIAGFADMFEGGADTDLIGGGVPTVKDAKPSSARKWTKTPIDKAKAKTLHPAHSSGALAQSTKRVGAVVHRAMASLKRSPGTQAARAAVAVRGLITILGLATKKVAATKKPLTPKQQAAVTKANAAAKKASTAAGNLKKSAIKALTAGKAAAAMAKDVRAKYGKKTRVAGELLGADPDPFNPGYLTDGTLDPNYDWGDVAYDPALDEVPPVPEPVVTQAPPLQSVINTPVPADAIRYDGPIAPYDVGSYWYWYGPQSTKSGPQGEMGITGFVWGWNHANWPNNNLATQWVWLTGQDSITHDQKWNVAPLNPPMTTDHVAELSVNGYGSQGLDLGPGVNVFGPPWGPLVGNPNRPNTKNLRWSMVDKCWFWYLEEAPESILAPIKYAAAAAKRAADAAEAAAAEAAQKQQLKDQADAEAAQAAQDAANALAESQAESQYRVAETQAAAADLQQQSQQAQFDLEAQKAELQLQQQQAQLDLQAQRQQLQWEQQQAQLEQQMQQLQMQQQATRPASPPAADYNEPATTEEAYDPEAGAVDEAALLEDYGPQLDTEVVGADGTTVGIDQWGNVHE